MSNGRPGDTEDLASSSIGIFWGDELKKANSDGTTLASDSSVNFTPDSERRVDTESGSKDQSASSLKEAEGYTDMVGRGAERGRRERRQLLEMMSLQFNSSDVAEKAKEEESGRGRRPPRMVGRPPKRKKQAPIENLTEDSIEMESSLASINTITQALKRVRKDDSASHLSRTTRQTAERRSGSEKDSGEESNDIPDTALTEEIEEPSPRRKTGRSRKSLVSSERPDSPEQYSQDTTLVRSMRGIRGFRRGRGRGRGRAGSLSPAVGRESPRSESSLDSLGSKNLRRPRQQSMEDYPSDGEQNPTKGRGRSRVSGFSGAVRRSRGRLSSDRSFSRRSVTPVTSEADDIPIEETLPIKRGVGRPPKRVSGEEAAMVSTPSLMSVDSPAGSTAGEQTMSSSKAGKKKKKKYFRGLRYSFVKKKKKPKSKSPGAQGMLDNTQETESLISEDVDADSFDSSSQVGLGCPIREGGETE